VKGYISAMLPKIGAGDRTQAALLAPKHGLDAEGATEALAAPARIPLMLGVLRPLPRARISPHPPHPRRRQLRRSA